MNSLPPGRRELADASHPVDLSSRSMADPENSPCKIPCGQGVPPAAPSDRQAAPDPGCPINVGIPNVARAPEDLRMLHWFQALLPSDDRFFELFAAHSHAIVAGAHGMRALLEGGDAVPKYCQVVMDQEHAADAVTRDILIAVGRSFITPFDRGAIKDLITAMDNTIDQMKKTAKAVVLFDIRAFTPEMREIGDAVVSCALLVEKAIPLLHAISREAAQINALTEQIQNIEDQADDLHDSGVKALFEQRRADPMGFITANEVYEHLEKTVDRFEDVANELQAIVIEHV
jgi:uncharacterized protein